MKQELLTAIALFVMGGCMMLISPKKIWSVTDKWKTSGGERPSKAFVYITRLLGLVFVAAGCYLLFS